MDPFDFEGGRLKGIAEYDQHMDKLHKLVLEIEDNSHVSITEQKDQLHQMMLYKDHLIKKYTAAYTRFHVAVSNESGVETLCGLVVADLSYMFDKINFASLEIYSPASRCPTCLEHPHYALVDLTFAAL